MAGAIQNLRGLDLRTVNAVLQQINSRLQSLENNLGTTTKQVGQTTLVQSQSNSSITDLAQRVAALENGTASAAAEVTLRADSAVTIYDAVYATSPSGCSTIDPYNLETVPSVIGIAETSASANAQVTVRRFGNMSIPSASFTPGAMVYWGDGVLTQDPSLLPVAIPIGLATGATSMFVLVGEAALVEHGVYTNLEMFLPVTYALVQFAVELVDTLAASPNGFVVKIGNQLQTRVLTGSGVTSNGDGVAGNPVIT